MESTTVIFHNCGKRVANSGVLSLSTLTTKLQVQSVHLHLAEALAWWTSLFRDGHRSPRAKIAKHQMLLGL